MAFRIEYRAAYQRGKPVDSLPQCPVNTSDHDKSDDSSNSNCRSNKRKALSGGRMRFWNEEDEIRILETLLEFIEDYGTTSVFNDAFYNRVKVVLSKDFEKTQLREKIKKLQVKYNKNVAGGCRVEGSSTISVSHHARVAFDLSDKMWGDGDLAMNADGSVVEVVVGKKEKEDDAMEGKDEDISLELIEFNKESKSEMEELETPMRKEEPSFQRSVEKQDEDKNETPFEEDMSSSNKEKEHERDVNNKLTEETFSTSPYSCKGKEKKMKKKKKKKKKKSKRIKVEKRDDDVKEKQQLMSGVSYPFLHELFGQIEERHGLQGITRIASQNIAPETAMDFERKLQRIFNARLKLEMKRHGIVQRVFQFVNDLKAT